MCTFLKKYSEGCSKIMNKIIEDSMMLKIRRGKDYEICEYSFKGYIR